LEKLPNGVFLNYYVSQNHAARSNWNLSFQHMMRIGPNDFRNFNDKIGSVCASFVYYCKKVEGKSSKRCLGIKEKIMTANKNTWNESQYEKKLSELDANTI
jgi:hypothetical protein